MRIQATYLRAGNDWAWVSTNGLGVSVIAHVRAMHAKLAVFGVHTPAAYDRIREFNDRIDAVDSDRPQLFGWRR